MLDSIIFNPIFNRDSQFTAFPYSRYSDYFDAIKPRKGGSDAVHNPIDAHLLIRHLATGWPAPKSSLENFQLLMAIAGIKFGTEIRFKSYFYSVHFRILKHQRRKREITRWKRFYWNGSHLPDCNLQAKLQPNFSGDFLMQNNFQEIV